MTKLDVLRTEHDAALTMAARLLALAEAADPRGAAIPIVMQLNRLLGLIRAHLAQEDAELYPALVASTDPEVARLAQRYVDEMGGLAHEFECFARRWSCSDSIAGSIVEFRSAVRQLVRALSERIERENLNLYPLAEAEASKQARKAA